VARWQNIQSVFGLDAALYQDTPSKKRGAWQ